jgi:energy-coupling factor transporter transmembrane protein EcfT
MVEFNKSTSILVSLIIGVILSFLFDNIVVLVVMGFLSTYMVTKEERTPYIGIITALIYATGNFIHGFFTVPPIPQGVVEQIAIDYTNTVLGFLVTILIAMMLGFLGGYPAYWTSKKNRKNNREVQQKLS